MTAPSFGEALAALSRAMSRLGRPWMIIGGLAVIVHGAPRSTLDADATVAGSGLPIEDLLAALIGEGFTTRIPDALRLARTAHVLIVRHEPSGIPADISLAWLPFEEDALARAKTLEFAGVALPFVQPEDLLVYKLLADRPRDLDDAERMLILDALLPSDPKERAEPPPPPRDLLAAAAMVRRLEVLRSMGLISDDDVAKERAAVERIVQLGVSPRAKVGSAAAAPRTLVPGLSQPKATRNDRKVGQRH